MDMDQKQQTNYKREQIYISKNLTRNWHIQQNSENVRNLEITVDKHLNYADYINNVNNKIRSLRGSTKKLDS